MPTCGSYPVAQLGHGHINLANLYIYHCLRRAAETERRKLRSLIDQVNTVADAQAKLLPDLADEVNRLKREIRLVTKGTPVTEPLDPASAQPLLRSDPNFNQQQYDAETALLKRAYRLAASIAHPDKGETHELFEEVRNAYLNRDLHSLTAIYLSITKGRNLYWQASEEGIYHVSSEYERPRVIQQQLKASPIYEIARHHLAGRVEQATMLMREHLVGEIAALMNELNYLGAQNG